MHRLFYIILIAVIPFSAISQVITTYAGRGIGMGGFSGDGGPATAAHIGGLCEGVFDASGNYYFPIRGGNRVRKISVLGIITTVAGTGASGYSGDGVAATTAQINQPVSVAVDSVDNLYIADMYNHRVRKIDAITGTITTVVGNGISGFTADGVAATSASISFPYHVCFDKFGNLFVSELGNYRIRKVNTSGIITTVAGNGTPGYSGDGGLADTTRINGIYGMCADTLGNLFIADAARVRKINVSTGIISTIAGTGTCLTYTGDGGPATAAEIYPMGMAFNGVGDLFMTQDQTKILRVDALGIIHCVAGTSTFGYSGDGGPATAAQISYPEGVAFDVCGNLYITDFNNQRIRKVTYPPILTTPSITLTGVTSMPTGSTVTVNATVANAGGSYIIHWMNHGAVFASTTVPVITYTKAPGADTITARVVSTASYGCYDSTTSGGHIITSATTGFDRLSNDYVVLYPNPVNDLLHIDNVKPGTAYDVVSIVGAVVHCGTLQAQENSISIRNLPPGIYMLALTNEQGIRTVHKIIKE